MQKIAIDMDDVLADCTGRFIDLYEEKFGIRVKREELAGKSLEREFPDHREIVAQMPHQPDFFRHMKVQENAQEVVEKLSKNYEIFIVSAAVPYPQSMIEKIDWLKQYFPFIDWRRNVVFCGYKGIIRADIMIDDHGFNLEHFQGRGLLFSAAHNTYLTGFERVNSWKEVEGLLC